MDVVLLIKIIHMSALSLLIVVFLARAATLFVGVQEDQQPNPKARTALVGLQHLALTLIVMTGVALLWLNKFEVQPWFYAKVILFLVLCSALSKAYKKDPSVVLAQRRAGVILAAFALLAILGLVMLKPVFG
ncbi:MAG: invasion protein expression up-regulator SirB [Acinetobacter sp.]|nr:SirB2 family protein [Acinetobacter sp.]MBP6353113.1 SirB2 family protein [Acinetobacter sp.]MBP7217816.1 SirB2 family protein [Acinetobacter sp.]TXJ04924.1 MAG: invasion protein expression up-regulator SirB [Acinetobacter sp.]